MLKLVLCLLERLGNRFQSTTKAKTEVNIQQKIPSLRFISTTNGNQSS